MNDAIEKLLGPLQSGWSPKSDEIHTDIQQCDLVDWQFDVAGRSGQLTLFGVVDLADRRRGVTGEVLWIDPYLDWALCDDGFFWLYSAEEGEKISWLGG